MPSAKGQTEDENFQRLDQQNKFLQRRINVKNDFYVEILEWNDGVENGLYGANRDEAINRTDYSRLPNRLVSMFASFKPVYTSLSCRNFVASNANQTTDNEMFYLIMYCLKCI